MASSSRAGLEEKWRDSVKDEFSDVKKRLDDLREMFHALRNAEIGAIKTEIAVMRTQQQAAAIRWGAITSLIVSIVAALITAFVMHK